ncbi:SAM-dependent methyltransferase, partial [Tianweitania sp.]|uniref:SAM-dependent methyltransferase n=1 Tax=Tianweitania sp. TaxID=2021634 RepID=UPI0028A23C34
MSGRLTVIGTGPGNPDQMTPQARAAIEAASDFFGYKPYLDRLQVRPDQTLHASDNREELDRAKAALELAVSGRHVAVVSGG